REERVAVGDRAHARGTRDDVSIALRKHHDVAFVQPQRLLADDGGPARAARDTVELDQVLDPGQDRGNDLARRRRLGHPRLGALDVVEQCATQPDGAQQVGQGVAAHRVLSGCSGVLRPARSGGTVADGRPAQCSRRPARRQARGFRHRGVVRGEWPRDAVVNLSSETFMETQTVPDFEAIKTRQRATWAAGDFGRIGVTLQIVGESLCEAVDLRSTDRVLDVAAGNGNASLAAARRFADVTSTDYVPELLAQGRRRAEAEGLPMTTQLADAEDLPFGAGTFDVVLS